MAKTKLKWTKKLPTVDGFYWWKRSGGAKDTGIRVRAIVERGNVVAVYTKQTSLSEGYWKGQWYGPIPSKEPI